MDSSMYDLINRFKGGDESAFEEIVRAHQDRIYNVCRQILGNPRDAEDASQDVFIKAYQKLDTLEPAPYLSSWLYRVAVNTCIDYKRKSAARPIVRPSAGHMEFMPEAGSSLPSPEVFYEAKKTGEAIQRGLGHISRKLRAVIVLKEVEGLSYEEIAAALDISIGTVKSRLSRAREELRRHLREDLGDAGPASNKLPCTKPA